MPSLLKPLSSLKQKKVDLSTRLLDRFRISFSRCLEKISIKFRGQKHHLATLSKRDVTECRESKSIPTLMMSSSFCSLVLVRMSSKTIHFGNSSVDTKVSLFSAFVHAKSISASKALFEHLVSNTVRIQEEPPNISSFFTEGTLAAIISSR